MKARFQITLGVALVLLSLSGHSQINSLEISEEKEAMFLPYLYGHHGGKEGLERFKREQPHQYLKELWYVSSSWYIKKDHLSNGATLDPQIVCIERFESYRKENEEVYLVLPGFRDAIVFLPASQLIYRFNEK